MTFEKTIREEEKALGSPQEAAARCEATIRSVLEECSGASLDDEADRNTVAEAMLDALMEPPRLAWTDGELLVVLLVACLSNPTAAGLAGIDLDSEIVKTWVLDRARNAAATLITAKR